MSKYLKENGIDEKKLDSIARRLNKIGKELNGMGLELFGWSGTGCIIKMDDNAPEGAYLVKSLTIFIDGGDPDYKDAPDDKD